MQTPPLNPAGEIVPEKNYSKDRRDELIAVIELAPGKLRDALAGLTAGQLDTRYRNWTVRQIVHHLADSHVHSYVRFKWTLTEDVPTIKAYDEGRWVDLADSRQGNIEPALNLLSGLHAQWVILLRGMSDEQYQRKFFHPERGKTVTLDEALPSYAWHCRHHTAQILWLRQANGW